MNLMNLTAGICKYSSLLNHCLILLSPNTYCRFQTHTEAGVTAFSSKTKKFISQYSFRIIFSTMMLKLFSFANS